MSKLKLKVKSNLKNDIEKEKQGGKDTRLLNYFDMKVGEKMTILFVPDTSGRLWEKFSVHGPNLRTPGVEKIACAKKSNGEHCPACQKAFDYLEEGKKPGNDYEEYKTEAKRWFPKDSTIAQCLVLDSPMDVNESPDGNQVKLMYLPYAVENIIKEAVVEGIVDEEDICMTPFVIKKTENQGGHASYANSYFSRKTISDEELAVFDDFVVEQFNFDDLDIVPSASSTGEVKEWLEKTIDKLSESSDNDDDGKDDKSKSEGIGNRRLSGVTDRMGRKAPEKEDTGDEDDDTDNEQQEDAGDEPAKETKSSTGASSLRDRLNSLQR